jgi:hypothetical protein
MSRTEKSFHYPVLSVKSVVHSVKRLSPAFRAFLRSRDKACGGRSCLCRAKSESNILELFIHALSREYRREAVFLDKNRHEERHMNAWKCPKLRPTLLKNLDKPDCVTVQRDKNVVELFGTFGIVPK